jgi:Flp pilus assembly protein TadB
MILGFEHFSSQIRNNEKNCLFVLLARQSGMCQKEMNIHSNKICFLISAHIDSQTVGVTAAAAVFVIVVALVCFIFILRRRRKKG